MHEPWITIVFVASLGLGLLSELNLLRIFLSDWREGRRDERAKSFRSRRRDRALEAPDRRCVSRPGLAAYLAAPVLIGSVAHAQDSVTTGQPTAAPAATDQPKAPSEAPKSPFSVQLNLDYTTAYFYHGIMQEDSGLILQPAAKLTVNLHEQDDFKIDVYIATWNSFQGQKTGAQTHGDFTEYWYESDLIGGLTIAKGAFSLSTQYAFLTSPSDAYQTVQELDFTLAYDDSKALGKFALHPYALLAIETGADASDGANSNSGTYLELGVAPGFSFDAGKTPVAITFPASVGLSLNDYYQNAAGEDDTFGFVQVGVKASVPLPITERYGKWTLNVGVAGMYLGDHTAQYNGGDHQQLIGTVGIQANF